MLKLAERAIDRIESAIESIDDSNGECSALLERARDIHIRAARGARPDPVALARDLYERETGDGYGTFDDAAWLYADVLGEAGLAEYRRLATEAWEKLPPLTGRSRQKAARRLSRPLGNSRPLRRARRRCRDAHRAARQGPVVALEIP